MKLTRTCMICNKPHERDIDLQESEILRIKHRRELGLMIQDIVPHLTADDREFLISGAHPACWETLSEQDEDDHD